MEARRCSGGGKGARHPSVSAAACAVAWAPRWPACANSHRRATALRLTGRAPQQGVPAAERVQFEEEERDLHISSEGLRAQPGDTVPLCAVAAVP